MLEVDNPQRIYIRGERQKILRQFMDADQAIRIKYDSKYAQSANYWKNSIGMSRGIEKLNVRAKKAAQETLGLQSGDNILLTGGPINGQSGNTNTIKIEQI